MFTFAYKWHFEVLHLQLFYRPLIKCVCNGFMPIKYRLIALIVSIVLFLKTNVLENCFAFKVMKVMGSVLKNY